MTKEEILQLINQNIADNDSGAITAEVLRQTLNSMVELGVGNTHATQSYVAWMGSFLKIDETTFMWDQMQSHEGSEDTPFDYEIKTDGEYLVIALPSDILVGSITSNGIEIPMQLPFVYGNYNVFVSSHKFKRGLVENILITIN